MVCIVYSNICVDPVFSCCLPSYFLFFNIYKLKKEVFVFSWFQKLQTMINQLLMVRNIMMSGNNCANAVHLKVARKQGAGDVAEKRYSGTRYTPKSQASMTHSDTAGNGLTN